MSLNNHQKQSATKIVALEQTLDPVDWEALELEDGALRVHLSTQDAPIETTVENTVDVNIASQDNPVEVSGTVEVSNFPDLQNVNITSQDAPVEVDVTNSTLSTEEVIPNTLSSSVVTVATSGTPIQGPDLPGKWVTVQSPAKPQPNSGGAWAANTGYMFVGTQNAPGPTIELAPGDKATFAVSNANVLWFDAETNGGVVLVTVGSVA